MKIYVIINIINKKIYVGQTIQSLKQRFNRHSWKCNKSRSAISSAIHKYGKENFDIILLEQCSSIEELNKQELYWINKLNSLSPYGYNLKSSVDGKGSLSKETKDKISKANKGRKVSLETREKLRISHLGYKVSEDTKIKLSKYWSGIRPSKLAQENSYKANTKIYKMISPDNKEIEIIDMAKFCKENNYSKSKMSELVNKKRLQYKGWKYISSKYLNE